jgi:SOS-response transcriptional repressor LexA
MNWKSFIKLLSDDFRVSIPKLASLTGLAQPTLTKIKNGKTQNPNQDTIGLIEKALNIKIIKDSSGNLSYKKIPEETKTKNFEDSIRNFDSNSFPVVSIVRAGQPNGVREDEILYYADFNYAKREGVIAVMIEGDSMEPEFKHGDLVLADKFIEPLNGDIVIAVFNNNEHTIKKFRNLMDEYIELIPVNKNYQNQIVHKSKVSAIYTVVRSYRNHR